MINIRITKEGKLYTATVDEFEEIIITGKTMKEVKDQTVELVKAELAKGIVPETEEKPKEKVSFGFAA